MGGSELFLLFPKGMGVKEQPPYINVEPRVYEDKLSKITSEIEDVEKLLVAENFQLFYDLENVNAFLSPIDVGEESYPDLFYYFIQVLQTWGDNWREDAQQNENTQYKYYHTPIQDDTLCEMTERTYLSGNGTSFLLVNCEAIRCKGDTIATTRDGVSATIDVRNLEVMPIAKWFETNRRPKRKFGLNTKHGENGRGAHPSYNGEKVSVLMCSKEEAHILLQSAIGTSYERSKPLFFYDTQHKQYIEFRKTTSGDKVEEYHGFHLDVADSERRVPKEIKELIGKILHPSLGR